MDSLIKGKVETLGTHRGLKELVDRFLSSQDVKQSSLGTYKRGLKQFTTWISTHNIINPTREDILSYKNYLINEKSLSALSVSGYLVVVRKFFEWTESIKLYPNIAKGIKGTKRERGFRKDCLTISQAKELLGFIDNDSVKGKRDYALLNLLIRTGLRTIEVIRANIEDIRQNSGEAVLWIQGKGRDSKDEFVLLTDETLKPILSYLETRPDADTKEPLFTSLSNRNQSGRLTTISVSRIVKGHLKKIGLNSKKLTAHSLRHTSITFALMGGATIQEAQALGRHASITTTMVYAHNINRVSHAPERKIDALLAS